MALFNATPEQFDRLIEAIEGEKRARADDMPTEADALAVLHRAYTRLQELGWNDAIYCPKDGSSFDAIEAGSTGIFRTHYSGAWPKGSWWAEDGGDLWPARPILYRKSPEEIARLAELGRRYRERAA